MDKSCFPNLILPCSGRKFKRSSIDGATWKECYWSKWWRWCDHDAAGPTGRLCLVVFHPLFPPSLTLQPQEHWGWRTGSRNKETIGDLGKCYLIREAKCQLGRCCGSWRRQRIFAGGGLSANSISSSVHGQTNAMEGYPPIWPTGDGEVISGQSCCDRGKEHIFQSVILSASGREIPRGLFQLTRESKPAIIFIDDIDLLASSNPNLKDHGG